MLGQRELPGNVKIAEALLKVLAESGDVGGRARALREAGAEAQVLQSDSGWIGEPVLRAMFRAVSADRKLAARVGRRLLSVDGIGLLLCYGGVATVEKAYRRCDQLLARETRSSRYEALEIDAERARVAFHPAADDGGGKRPNPLFCGLRQGMLEAVPSLFGLLPARVRETECAARGAASCVYEIRWSRTSRGGLYAGAVAGVALGLGAAAGLAMLGSGSAAIWLIPPGVLLLGLLGAGAGRSIDLARQLEAVAGARRGQLALLDQADRSLAEKMDQLGKLEGDVETPGPSPASGTGLVPVTRLQRAPDAERTAPDIELAAGASRRLHDVLGRLQTGLGEVHSELVQRQNSADAQLAQLVEDCVDASQQIQAVGAELARRAQEGGRELESVDLAAIVRRAVDVVRPGQTESTEIALDIDVEPAPVRCEPYQMEQVVVQLMRNAVEAVEGSGSVRVGLCEAAPGFEVTVEDSGPGIDPDLLDRLFDPFHTAPVAGVTSGFGLTVSYRIVQEHGGQLRVESEPGHGTRVTVTLPRDHSAPESGDSPPSE